MLIVVQPFRFEIMPGQCFWLKLLSATEPSRPEYYTSFPDTILADTKCSVPKQEWLRKVRAPNLRKQVPREWHRCLIYILIIIYLIAGRLTGLIGDYAF
jgi:hypothetical protein